MPIESILDSILNYYINQGIKEVFSKAELAS